MSSFHTAREFAFSASQVYAAFAAPERLARWWGPAGFSNRFEHCEFVPGGRWRFVMIGPDGHEYPNESRFAELITNELIVIDHVVAPMFRLTVRLTALPDDPGHCRLDWEQAFADAAVAEQVRHIVVPANEQNLDRLGAELARGLNQGLQTD
ncbi:SRPBCC domain-containing protein [Paucibacter sp. APW11]|uniref:SRPBCC domain-containing protein n=1 Tax=Roseateles aquae TaxID=3077235 RepID=A0ABU3PIL8_9BURK|nr:SRPBCC domain-containing protein [Paucibacter sp. APW11]MDT9002409.1 SRPBCC domain-containing protein [Paucibacter sp. APW11]